MTDIAVPDQANFDFGGDPIPDNFLDETISKAVTQHSRKESQVLSVQNDFSKIVDVSVASNIAQNLIGNGGVAPKPAIDPDEDDVRIGIEEVHDPSGPQLDDVLIATVTEHKRKESRQDFLESKLHELFPQNSDESGDGDTFGGGVGQLDMSHIANNLVAFLHDDPDSAAPTAINATMNDLNQIAANNGNEGGTKTRHKARGSTDLSALQEEIQRLQSTVKDLQFEVSTKEELNGRVLELENTNHDLMKQIEYLQRSKTQLAVESTKCIDELRSMLVSYQRNLGLKQ